MKSFRNALLKQKILLSIHTGTNNAKNLFKQINYPHHIDSLYRELNFLVESEYLTSQKIDGISYYTITELGRIHAFNPMIAYEERKNKSRANAVRIFNTDSKLQELLVNHIKNLPEPALRELVNSLPIPIHDATTKIVTQQVPVSPLTPDQSESTTEAPTDMPAHYNPDFHIVYHANANSEQDFANIGKTNNRREEIKRRREIAIEYYQKRYIYGGFFSRWGGHFRPVLLKDGSIEIISDSNPEWNREHVARELLSKEITEAKFHIKDVTQHGIFVTGKGMRQPKFLMF